MRQPKDSGPSFEETYPHYPFAELVRLAIAVGGWLARVRQASHDGALRARRPPPSRRAREEVGKISMGRLPE